MKSKTKLFDALDRFFDSKNFSTQGLTHPCIGNETYGPTSCIYIQANGYRATLEKFLTKERFPVNREYQPGSQFIEVTVSYFKGNCPRRLYCVMQDCIV